MEMGITEWSRGEVVGRGSFATVSLAHIRSTKADGTELPVLMAVKSAPFCAAAFLRHEESVLSALGDCPHLIRCFGHDTSADLATGALSHNLFLEYAPGGSLHDVLRRAGGKLPEPAVRRHARSVLRGLRHVHARRYAHCDLKPQNILVGACGAAKIADFGLAVEAQLRGGGLRGTPRYVAPEAAARGEYGPPADVWALGCTVAEMASGRPAWTRGDCSSRSGSPPRRQRSPQSCRNKVGISCGDASRGTLGRGGAQRISCSIHSWQERRRRSNLPKAIDAAQRRSPSRRRACSERRRSGLPDRVQFVHPRSNPLLQAIESGTSQRQRCPIGFPVLPPAIGSMSGALKRISIRCCCCRRWRAESKPETTMMMMGFWHELAERRALPRPFIFVCRWNSTVEIEQCLAAQSVRKKWRVMKLLIGIVVGVRREHAVVGWVCFVL